MSVKQHCADIQRINPDLTSKECLLIHYFMNDMAFALQQINFDHFTLRRFQAVMQEHFLEYHYGTSIISDTHEKDKDIEALLIAKESLEFNVFMEDEIKVAVFREDDAYHHIFQISVTSQKL